MSELTAPESLDQLRDAVLSTEHLLAVGNQTKPALCSVDAPVVSTRRLSGIVQYEPSEFTFTALAGTPVGEISETLAREGQFLPFDPVLIDAGSTIGGTVAAGLSGSGRFRYGGVRDFLLGVRFLSGEGEWIDSGGKVVKNAAGFDLPKFFVGSLGRYGVMAELTFKVFPRPVAELTLRVHCSSHDEALQRMSFAANSRWELFAIDYQPHQQSIQLRLGGPPEANEAIAGEIRSKWSRSVEETAEAEGMWRQIRELDFGDFDTVIKVPTSGSQMQALCEALGDADGTSLHVALAGQLVWVAVAGQARLRSLDSLLQSLQLSGLVVVGDGPCWLGCRSDSQMQQAIKRAMDPNGRFPELPITATSNTH